MPSKLIIGVIAVTISLLLIAVFVIYGLGVTLTFVQLLIVGLIAAGLVIGGTLYYLFGFLGKGVRKKKEPMTMETAFEIARDYAYRVKGIRLTTEDITQNLKKIGINYNFGFYAFQDIENTKDPLKPVQIVVSNMMSDPKKPFWGVAYFDDKPPIQAKQDPFVNWRGSLEGASTDKLVPETEMKLFESSSKRESSPTVLQQFSNYERLRQEHEKDYGKKAEEHG